MKLAAGYFLLYFNKELGNFRSLNFVSQPVMATGLVETARLVVQDNTHLDSSLRSHRSFINTAAKDVVWDLKKEKTGWKPSSEDDFAVLAVRNIVLDMCMQNGGGHGGSALGMAAIGIALWKHVMRFNPSDPDWFDRDRFVLSNGR